MAVPPLSSGELERYRKETGQRLRRERLQQVRRREDAIAKAKRCERQVRERSAERSQQQAEVQTQLLAKRAELEALLAQRAAAEAARGAAAEAAEHHVRAQQVESERQVALKEARGELRLQRGEQALRREAQPRQAEQRERYAWCDRQWRLRRVEDKRAAEAVVRARDAEFDRAEAEAERRRRAAEAARAGPRRVQTVDAHGQIDYAKTCYHIISHGVGCDSADAAVEAEWHRQLSPSPAPTPLQLQKAESRGRYAERESAERRADEKMEQQLKMEEARSRFAKAQRLAHASAPVQAAPRMAWGLTDEDRLKEVLASAVAEISAGPPVPELDEWSTGPLIGKRLAFQPSVIRTRPPNTAPKAAKLKVGKPTSVSEATEYGARVAPPPDRPHTDRTAHGEDPRIAAPYFCANQDGAERSGWDHREHVPEAWSAVAPAPAPSTSSRKVDSDEHAQHEGFRASQDGAERSSWDHRERVPEAWSAVAPAAALSTSGRDGDSDEHARHEGFVRTDASPGAANRQSVTHQSHCSRELPESDRSSDASGDVCSMPDEDGMAHLLGEAERLLRETAAAAAPLIGEAAVQEMLRDSRDGTRGRDRASAPFPDNLDVRSSHGSSVAGQDPHNISNAGGEARAHLTASTASSPALASRWAADDLGAQLEVICRELDDVVGACGGSDA